MTSRNALVELHVGAPAVQVRIGGQLIDPDTLGAVRIRRGRGDHTEATRAATCSLSILSSALPQLPSIGDAVLVELTDQVGTWAGMTAAQLADARPRFTGTITDLAATPSDTVGLYVVAITAASRLSTLARTFLPAAAWPAELDGPRAGRILQGAVDAGALVALGVVDPGQRTVRAKAVDGRTAAAGLLDQLQESSGGLLVELRDGQLEWHDALHRQYNAPDVTLDADDVLRSTVATQQLGGLVNDMAVTYGDADPRPAVRVTELQSVSRFGPFSIGLDSELVDQAAATDLATLRVGKQALPRWVFGALQVELLRGVTAAVATALLQLQPASLVLVTGFPSAGPFVTRRLWVEGWTETVSRDSWSIDLAVVDYGLLSTPPVWNAVPRDITWAQLGDLTFLQAYGWDPGPPALGRFVDTAADLHWNTYPPTPTWSTV